MKIQNVEPLVVGMPIAEPVRTSFGTMTHRYAILVRIETDAGLVGWGESWSNFPAWSPYERVHTIRDGIAPFLMGEDPLQVTWLHDKLRRGTEALGRQWGAPGPLFQAISAVDIALWDIMGQEMGQPICRLWGGGTTTQVPVYASGIGPGGVPTLVPPMQARGITCFKLKVGFGTETDQENLALIREVIGPEATLLTDANQAWDLATAMDMAPILADFEPYWLEEPLPADRFEDMSALREVVPFRIAAGENVYGRGGFRRLLDAKAVDVIQPDICKTGGLTESRVICEMAAAWDVPFAPHYLGGAIGLIASLHLFAATPGGWMMELDSNANPLREELGGDLLAVRNGCLAVPAGAGLGLTPDPQLLERYRIQIA